jgi:cell division protein FtsB
MAMSTFIDNIAILAIENCLMQPLETIFTGSTVGLMADQKIKQLTAEPSYTQANRKQLKSDLEKLQAGLNVCRRYIAQTASPSKPCKSKSSSFYAINGLMNVPV